MKSARAILLTGVAFLVMVTDVRAQTTTTTTQPAAPPDVITQQISGEVITVGENNSLLVKLIPTGEFRVFDVKPDRKFIIDGQPRRLDELVPGTVLTATVQTTAVPVTIRTSTVTNGTVWYVQNNHVVLTLESGENRSYTVPDGFTFTVDGKPATVGDLKPKMKISAEKVVEEPHLEVSSEAVEVTGTAPK